MQKYFQVASESVAAKVMDGEALIINVSTGIYYSLNPMAAHVWQLALAGHSEAAIRAEAERTYGDPQAGAEVGAFLQVLTAAELLAAHDAAEGLAVEPVEGTAWSVPFERPTMTDYDDVAHMVALDPPLPELIDR